MFIFGYPLLGLVQIIDSIMFLYGIVVIAYVVLSWVNPDPLNPLVRIIRNLCDPVLDKLRHYIPTFGGLDLSALALLLSLYFVRIGILPIFERLSMGMIN